MTNVLRATTSGTTGPSGVEEYLEGSRIDLIFCRHTRPTRMSSSGCGNSSNAKSSATTTSIPTNSAVPIARSSMSLTRTRSNGGRS